MLVWIKFVGSQLPRPFANPFPPRPHLLSLSAIFLKVWVKAKAKAKALDKVKAEVKAKGQGKGR